MFSSPLGITKIKATIELLHIEEHVHFQNKEEYTEYQKSLSFTGEKLWTEPEKFPCIGIYITTNTGYCRDYKIVYWIHDFEILEQTE